MYTDKNFKFRINVSNESYENKEIALKCLSSKTAKEAGRNIMAFKETTLDITEFLNLACSGYSFCGALFVYEQGKKYWSKNSKGEYRKGYPFYTRKNDPNKGCLKISYKKDEYFKSSQVIFLDIDDTKFQPLEYIERLTFKPSCVYMSYSDGVLKGNGKSSRRFRLVYIFNEELKSKTFTRIAEKLHTQAEIDLEEPMDDFCGTRKVQYMNGNFGNLETYRTDIIYSWSDFNYSYIREDKEFVVSSNVEVQKSFFDCVLVRDMKSMTYTDLTSKYCQRFKYFWRTERESDWNEFEFGVFYQQTEEDYIQLFYPLHKHKDGEHRRRLLYMRAALRRLINPESTPSEILYNLYIDRERFFDNSDEVLTIDCLQRKVNKAFEKTIDEIRSELSLQIENCKKNKPEFIINSSCINKVGNSRKIYKDMRYNDIASRWDSDLTIKENIELLKDDFSESTIRRAVKDRKLKYKKQEFTVDPELSIRKNVELLKSQGIKVSYETVRKEILKLKEPVEELVEEPVQESELKAAAALLGCSVDSLKKMGYEKKEEPTPSKENMMELGAAALFGGSFQESKVEYPDYYVPDYYVPEDFESIANKALLRLSV